MLLNLFLSGFNFSFIDLSNIPGYVFIWYYITHSFVTITIITLLFYFIVKRFPWPILGWYLHVFLDIPTHETSFFPTHFLFPISSFHISGINWAVPWFMISNYSALAGVYLLIFINRRRNKEKTGAVV